MEKTRPTLDFEVRSTDLLLSKPLVFSVLTFQQLFLLKRIQHDAPNQFRRIIFNSDHLHSGYQYYTFRVKKKNSRQLVQVCDGIPSHHWFYTNFHRGLLILK